jgi:hypothetical protein
MEMKMLIKLFQAVAIRLSLIYSRPSSLLIVLSSAFLSNVGTILFPENIFEFPNKAILKISNVLDLLILIIPVFFIMQIIQENWHTRMMRKWKHKKESLLGFHFFENFLCSFFFSFIFLLFIGISIFLFNVFLGIDNSLLFEYFSKRLLFLGYVSFCISLIGNINFGRSRFVLGLILSFFIWKLPSLLVSYFFLSDLSLSMINLIFPYSFSFSITDFFGESYCVWISFGVLFLSCLSSLLVKPKSFKVLRVYSIGVFFSLSLGSSIFFLNNFRNQISQNVDTLDLKTDAGLSYELYFSRKNILSNYGTLISDYRNYFYVRNLLFVLKRKKLIKEFTILDRQRFKTPESKHDFPVRSISGNKNQIYFSLKESKGPLLSKLFGFNVFEFKTLLHEFFLRNNFGSAKKIGITSLGSIWSEKDGGKSNLLKIMESIYNVDVLSLGETNFSNFDLIIITDDLRKNENYFELVYDYFLSGGKVIFITDNYSLSRNDKYMFSKIKKNSKNFLLKLNISLNPNQYLLPKSTVNFQNLHELIDSDDTLLSHCDHSRCASDVGGVFLRQSKGGSYLLPSSFSIVDNSPFRYRPLITLLNNSFDSYENDVDILDVINVSSGTRINTPQRDHLVAVEVSSSENNNVGVISLIGDMDIFNSSVDDDMELNVTGKQFVFSRVISMLSGFNPAPNKNQFRLSERYLGLVKKWESLVLKRSELLKKIKNLKIKYTLVQSNLNPRKIKHKDAEIKNDLKQTITQLNQLSLGIINRFKNIRIMFFTYSLFVCGMMALCIRFLSYLIIRGFYKRIIV